MRKKRKSKKSENETKAQRRVKFKMLALEAQNVFLASDFNGWNTHSHPLKRDTDGTWKININLRPGKYEYRFLVDGKWKNDPNCTSFALNPFGDENCVLILE